MYYGVAALRSQTLPLFPPPLHEAQWSPARGQPCSQAKFWNTHFVRTRGRVPLLNLSWWGQVISTTGLPIRNSAIQNANGIVSPMRNDLEEQWLSFSVRIKWLFLYRKFTWKVWVGYSYNRLWSKKWRVI